jgi:hemolytic enterotoxin HBL
MSNSASTGAAPAPKIGPGAIAKPAMTGGPSFALSSTNWIAIQTYVMEGLALPITQDKFKEYLGKGAPSDLSDFKPLLECFSKIHDQCSTWQKQVFPDSVSLASDIYDYGTHKAPSYFPPITKLADRLTAKPDDAEAKEKLKALLTNLTTDAQQRADKATAVKTQIQKFADDTLASRSTLSGTPDKPGGLLKKYQDEYGGKSKEVTELNQQIATQKEILKKATDEYNYDVVVAATTPTYVWAWPIGTIPAIVVAGVYGKRAVDALDQLNAAKQKISEMEVKLAADALLMIGINTVESSTSKILNDLNAALPIIELIEGVWGGIADDLQSLLKQIDVDIRQALPILMSLGVDETLRSWHDVALRADAYRTHAYVVTN